MMVYLGFSPRPMARITSGIRAMGGMVRKNWIQGSRNFRIFGYQPIRKEMGMAHRKARPKPTPTRFREIPTSFQYLPPALDSERSAFQTCLGLARNVPMDGMLARRLQIRKPNRMEHTVIMFRVVLLPSLKSLSFLAFFGLLILPMFFSLALP